MAKSKKAQEAEKLADDAMLGSEAGADEGQTGFDWEPQAESPDGKVQGSLTYDGGEVSEGIQPESGLESDEVRPPGEFDVPLHTDGEGRAEANESDAPDALADSALDTGQIESGSQANPAEESPSAAAQPVKKLRLRGEDPGSCPLTPSGACRRTLTASAAICWT